jgi:hypothetical protein
MCQLEPYHISLSSWVRFSYYFKHRSSSSSNLAPSFINYLSCRTQKKYIVEIAKKSNQGSARRRHDVNQYIPYRLTFKSFIRKGICSSDRKLSFLNRLHGYVFHITSIFDRQAPLISRLQSWLKAQIAVVRVTKNSL